MLLSDGIRKGRATMTGDIAVLISWLALVATLYQLYLQRTHNEKSLQPLGQIDLEDRQGHLCIQVTNNGLGPMIIDQLLFWMDGKRHTTLDDCLELPRSSYTAIGVNESVRKVILPNGRLVIFETRFEQGEEDLYRVHQQLSVLHLQVSFHDIYSNKMSIERDFQWFTRHKIKAR